MSRGTQTTNTCLWCSCGGAQGRPIGWRSSSSPRPRPVQYEAQGPERGMPRTHEGHNNRPQLGLFVMASSTLLIGRRRAFALVGRSIEAWRGGVVGLLLLLVRGSSRLDRDACCRHEGNTPHPMPCNNAFRREPAVCDYSSRKQIPTTMPAALISRHLKILDRSLRAVTCTGSRNLQKHRQPSPRRLSWIGANLVHDAKLSPTRWLRRPHPPR